MTKEQQFMEEVLQEVSRARKKFPTSEGLMVALTEEVGEVAKALTDEPWKNVHTEAVQTAAMALRLALEGDPTLDVIRARRGVLGA